VYILSAMQSYLLKENFTILQYIL